MWALHWASSQSLTEAQLRKYSTITISILHSRGKYAGEGEVVVPVEPTEGMLMAAYDCLTSLSAETRVRLDLAERKTAQHYKMAKRWRAMISVATGAPHP